MTGRDLRSCKRKRGGFDPRTSHLDRFAYDKKTGAAHSSPICSTFPLENFVPYFEAGHRERLQRVLKEMFQALQWEALERTVLRDTVAVPLKGHFISSVDYTRVVVRHGVRNLCVCGAAPRCARGARRSRTRRSRRKLLRRFANRGARHSQTSVSEPPPMAGHAHPLYSYIRSKSHRAPLNVRHITAQLSCAAAKSSSPRATSSDDGAAMAADGGEERRYGPVLDITPRCHKKRGLPRAQANEQHVVTILLFPPDHVVQVWCFEDDQHTPTVAIDDQRGTIHAWTLEMDGNGHMTGEYYPTSPTRSRRYNTALRGQIENARNKMQVGSMKPLLVVTQTQEALEGADRGGDPRGGPKPDASGTKPLPASGTKPSASERSAASLPAQAEWASLATHLDHRK